MLGSIVGNSNPKPIQAENSKLAKENRKLLQEINELREVNRKMENRWETTERDLKGVKKELKVIIDEKDNNYNKLEEEFLRVQGQLDTFLKKATSSRIYSPSATLHSKGLSASSRRTKIENLFSDENLQSGVEEQYPIWAATLKRVDERSKKAKEELQTSGDSAGSYYVDKTKSLQRKIEELEEEKAKLYLDNTKLEVVVKQKEKEKNQFIEKLTACETKLGSTEEEIRILQVSLKSSESTQKYNDSSLNRLKTKVSELEVENLRLVEQRNELQIQADRAHREARLAKGELEYGLKHAARPNSHGQEEYRLKNEVATLNSRIGELESQLEQSHTKIQELENQKAQAQTFTNNKQRVEELEKINDHIRQERDQLKLRLEQSLSLEAGHTKRIQELEIHLTNCYREIKEFRNENEELRLVQSEVEVLKKNLQAVQVQNEALEVRALIVEDENKRLRENVGEEIGDEERIVSNLKMAEFERMEVLQNYKRVCIENEKIKTELSEVIAAHKECLRELRDTKTEADALKLQAGGLEKNEEEYFNQVAIFEELNQKLITAESLAQEYKQAKERLDEEVIAIREEKQKLESSITEIQQTLSTNQKENSVLKAELRTIKTDHEVLREELDKKSINNEVLKGLLEDQKKNQWKFSGVQIDRRLESEESFLSVNFKQESKRKGISSDRIIQFYSPQGKSDALKWEQGYKDQLKGSYRKNNGYESRLFPEEKSYWSQDLGRGINAETKPLWDSGYLKTEGDDAKKKKYGSVSLAYDKKFSKF